MKRFEARKAILEAASQSLDPRQVRALRFAMAVRPFKTRDVIDMVTSNCQAASLVTEDGEMTEEATDWAAILAIILELLPLILKLFGL
jgi:hypothetical protein